MFRNEHLEMVIQWRMCTTCLWPPFPGPSRTLWLPSRHTKCQVGQFQTALSLWNERPKHHSPSVQSVTHPLISSWSQEAEQLDPAHHRHFQHRQAMLPFEPSSARCPGAEPSSWRAAKAHRPPLGTSQGPVHWTLRAWPSEGSQAIYKQQLMIY